MIVASGTALTKSRVWRQMLADCSGKDLVLETAAAETTSRGIAALAGSYLGLHSLEATGYLHDSQVERQTANVTAHAAYLEARHAQEALYRKLYG
jgi:sugar (pentulose or hexulose) kinase